MAAVAPVFCYLLSMDHLSPVASSIHDFSTWEPMLRLLLAANRTDRDDSSIVLTGRIGLHGWGFSCRPPEDREVVARVQRAVEHGDVGEIRFAAEIFRNGKTALHLFGTSSAVEGGITAQPGAVILVEGSAPAPWRRLPDATPDAVPAAAADPVLLERTLRERLPDAIGATESEIADTEKRLGLTLPEELKALYRVTRADLEDFRIPGSFDEWDWDGYQKLSEAVGYELSPLDGLRIADVSTRPHNWRYDATTTLSTPPGAAVQSLVGSPGWIDFASNGGDQITVDLTPGPGGHIGQIILISHEETSGAELVADCLTDLVLDRPGRDDDSRAQSARAKAYVRNAQDLSDAAHPDLEVLCLSGYQGEPASLAPILGLPRLRTLEANPGTLADPLEIAALTSLEYLALGPREWRVLLDAEAVPRGLSAAGFTQRYNDENTVQVVAIANELLALWDRPQISHTIIEGEIAVR